MFRMGKSANKARIVPPDDLEDFDPGRPPPHEDPWVTRTTTGVFVLNPAAREALGSPDAVRYLYSPSKQILGFKAADPDAPNAYPLYSQGNSKNFQSAGKKFHSHYKLATPDQATRHKAELIGDTLFIDLADEDALLVNRKPKARR